jgi:ABC-type hemin transport system substrate-binding protein
MVSGTQITAEYAAEPVPHNHPDPILPQEQPLPLTVVDGLVASGTRTKAAPAFKKEKTMKVSTDLKAGGYLQTAATEAGKAWNQVTNFIAKADAEAKSFTRDALNTTSDVTSWISDTLSKF